MEITEILTWITGIIVALGALSVAIIQAYKKTQAELQTLPRRIRQQTTMDNELIQHMEDLKERLNADRVQIYDFHNGGHYANGRSAIKASCTYEVTRVGIQNKQDTLQNLPLSCIPRFIGRLFSNGYINVKDINDIKEQMPATYELKKNMGVTGFYDVVINNRQYEPIGFLAVQYTTNEFGVLSERDRQEVFKLKTYAEDLLSQHEK